MNATEFCYKTKSPKSLIQSLIFLNLGTDFARFCEQPKPQDWLPLTPSERALFALPLLNNAWRNLEKPLSHEARGMVNRVDVLEVVFAKLVETCSKLHAGIKNPGGYIFSAIRNEMLKEITRQKSPGLWLEDLPTSLFSWGDKCPADIAEQISQRLNLGLVKNLLDSFCTSSLEREVCDARCDRLINGWCLPKYASDIAFELEIPLTVVVSILEEVQTRYLDSVNAKKLRQHKKQLQRVPLGRIAPPIAA